MKVNICFEFKEGASGGGNQFLKALKDQFKNRNIYTESTKDADIIIFNSYQYIIDLIKIKIKYPNKHIVHRIDGPIRLYNEMSDKRDLITNTSNHYLADATIYQSNFSKQTNLELGLRVKKLSSIIINAPSENFSIDNKASAHKNAKITIISSSWSENIKKGFETYRWLDQNLDFKRYDFIFAGRSPYQFKNIKFLGALSTRDLSHALLKSDIYITASQNDPCSNSLLEAMHTGMPVVALNSGGHPELAQGKKAFLFEGSEDILEKIELASNSIELDSDIEHLPTIEEASSQYINFLKEVHKTKKIKKNIVHQYFSVLMALISIFIFKVDLKIKKLKRK